MPTFNSAYQPAFSYQVDPLLNISPLINIYSNCLTHVVDTDGLFQLKNHNFPIVLSHKLGILNSSLAYQPAFAGVRSHKCLLTIAALFFSWNYDQEKLRDYIIPQSFYAFRKEALLIWNYARIYPQIFLTITNQSVHSIDLYRRNERGVTCYEDWPLFFALQLNKAARGFPRISGILSLEVPIGSLEFNCSLIEQTITIFAKFFQMSWQSKNFKSDADADGRNPFSRKATTGMKNAVNSFILGPNRQRFTDTSRLECFPLIWKASSYYSTASEELILAGRTATIMFVPTAGVFTPKSSYRVYFSPLTPRVWFGILTSTGISLVIIFGTYRMHREHSPKIGLLMLAADLATWALAAAIGQYKHSGVPMISGRMCRKVILIVAPIVAAWFIMYTFLLNVYSAVFNSDATRSFYYMTNYTKILELPQGAQVYILVNESYVKSSKTSCEIEWETSCFQDIVPSACSIRVAMFGVEIQTANQIVILLGTDAKSKKQRELLTSQMLKIREFVSSASYVCANQESLGRAFGAQPKGRVFISSLLHWKLTQMVNLYYHPNGIGFCITSCCHVSLFYGSIVLGQQFMWRSTLV